MLYEFGVFRLDARKRLLYREGVNVPLTPKAFDTLLALVAKHGTVLGKDELMKELWPDSFVEEANLTQNVSTVRKALGESPNEHRYIMTVPGRGYRFVADVNEFAGDHTDLLIEERTHSRIIIEEEIESDTDIVGTAQLLPDANSVVINARALPERRENFRDDHHLGSLKKHKWILLAALVVIIIAVSGIAYGLYRFLNRGHRALALAEIKLRRLTTSGNATAAAISPDGKYVAYVVDDAGKQSLWIKQVEATGTVQIIAPEETHIYGLVYTPDGNYLCYIQSTMNNVAVLYRMPVLGGSPVRLTEDIDTAITFSPDGKRFAFIRGYPDQSESVLMVARTDGGAEERLASFKGNVNYYIQGRAPAWSPDGKVIAATAKVVDDKGEYDYIFLTQVESKEVKSLTTERWEQIGRIIWLADASGIVMTAADQETAPAQQIWVVSRMDGTARRITNDLNDYRDISAASNSKSLIALQSDRQANIWITPYDDTQRARQITSSNYDGLGGLAWTPNGKLVYSTRSGANRTLSITDADGNNQKPVFAIDGTNSHPAVSPDGHYIVFTSNRTGRRQLWRTEITGDRLKQLTYGADENAPYFSPDGKWVVYKSNLYGQPNILRVPIEGGDAVRLTDKISGWPAVSPNGKLIACSYRATALSPNKTAIVSFNGGPPVSLYDYRLAQMRWSTDGHSFLFIKTLGEVSNIWLQPIDGGEPRQVTDFNSDRIFFFASSFDGKSLAFARGQTRSDVVLITDVR